MKFEEWQEKHGPNGGAYDIEMQKAGWDGRQPEIDRLISEINQLKTQVIDRGNSYEQATQEIDTLKKDLVGMTTKFQNATNMYQEAAERVEYYNMLLNATEAGRTE